MANPRVRLGLMAAATIALVAIAVFLLTSDPRGSDAATAVTGGFAGAIRPVAPPADFALDDQDGRRFAMSTLRGTPTVVTFMYTTCDNDCPTMTQQIRGALDQVGRDVPVVAVSVDPARDTAARARKFLASQHMTGRMRFLLGSQSELQPVWRAFGVQPQERGREHSASVVVLDDRGVARTSFPVDQLTPEGLAHDLRALGAGTSAGA